MEENSFYTQHLLDAYYFHLYPRNIPSSESLFSRTYSPIRIPRTSRIANLYRMFESSGRVARVNESEGLVGEASGRLERFAESSGLD